MILAAIDIGSNAVRLLFNEVFQKRNQVSFKKIALYRIPLRLGEDVFTKGKISSKKRKQFIETMEAFQKLINVMEARKVMACATSAMREAKNSSEIIKEVKSRTSISIQVISGEEEAEIILSNHFENLLSADNSYLYIDVGGGSTELTVMRKGYSSKSRSFDIGTIRLLKDQFDHNVWIDMQSWVKEHSKGLQNLIGIGSGGNINKLVKLAPSKSKNKLSYTSIKNTYEILDSFSYNDRIQIFDLKPDRADVILPACKIYLSVMKWAKVKLIHIPQIGLADGMMHIMYKQMKKK